ncbi:MAG: hypothetical protein MZU97_23205 [Bacillus subtilis]|nr:hypothetical protein [Bacillus subtilis]
MPTFQAVLQAAEKQARAKRMEPSAVKILFLHYSGMTASRTLLVDARRDAGTRGHFVLRRAASLSRNSANPFNTSSVTCIFMAIDSPSVPMC